MPAVANSIFSHVEWQKDVSAMIVYRLASNQVIPAQRDYCNCSSATKVTFSMKIIIRSYSFLYSVDLTGCKLYIK